MTKDLPAQQTESADLLAGAGPDDYVEPIPKQHGELWLDSGKQKKSVKPGTWNFMGQALATLQFAFLKGHLYRKLFEAAYSPGAKNRVVCMSWDGVHAYGQAKGGWCPKEMKAQECGNIDQGGMLVETCRQTRWHKEGGKNVCACPEKKRWLLMCFVPSKDIWLPAFYDAEGGHVRRWQRQYDRVAALGTQKAPLQKHVVQLSAARDNSEFWNPVFGEPSVMPDPDWELVVAWIIEHGSTMFRESIENTKTRAQALSQDEEEDTPKKLEPVQDSDLPEGLR